MSSRRRSALLWGVVGLLAFGVLVQGYFIVVGPLDVTPLALGALAVAVGLVVAGVAYMTEHRLAAKGRT